MLFWLRRTEKHHRWLLLAPLALSGLLFYTVEQLVIQPVFYLHISLDDSIPFVAAFVIPYVVWYFYVGLTAFFLFWANPKEFVRMALFLSLGMLIACLIYSLFPNGQSLRPDLAGAEDPLSRLVFFIYSKDSPANCSPSIHVVYSVSAHIALRRHIRLHGYNRLWTAASFVTAMLCGISTVFIKQHSAQDIFTGLSLCILLYFLIYQWLLGYMGESAAHKQREQQVST